MGTGLFILLMKHLAWLREGERGKRKGKYSVFSSPCLKERAMKWGKHRGLRGGCTLHVLSLHLINRLSLFATGTELRVITYTAAITNNSAETVDTYRRYHEYTLLTW